MALTRRPGSGPSPMLWIDRIHRWTGAIVGLLLAVLGVTGTLLLYEDAWVRLSVPHAADPLVHDDAALDRAVERLMSTPSTRPGSITFPSEDLGVFRLSFERGAGAYADQSGAIVERWASKWERPELWVFDLHHHLWMGEAGTTTAGILALIGMGFVITGVLLWWRTRRTFAPRVLPQKLTRVAIIRHHRDLGALMTPLLFAQLLTGAMITIRPVAKLLLAPLASPVSIEQSLAPPKTKGGRLSADFKWGAALQAAREQFPGAALRSVGVPRGPGQLVRVRVRQQSEWSPNGRTVVWFDPADGRLVEARDARALPLAARAYNLVYPLHASSVGGIAYKAVLTATGLALTLLGTLAVCGFWSYQVRQPRGHCLVRSSPPPAQL